MSVLKQKPRPAPREEAIQVDETKTPQETTEDIDALLDEIDEVLEENAQEFISKYIQKGGE